MNILYKFKSLLFCLYSFGVRRTIDLLDSENQPGSGALGLKVDNSQKIKTKEKALKIILNIHYIDV